MAAAIIVGAGSIFLALVRRLRSLRTYSQELRARRESIGTHGWVATVDAILATHGLADDSTNAVVADVPTVAMTAQGLAKHDNAVTRVMPPQTERMVWTADKGKRTVGLMSPRPKAGRDGHDASPLAARPRSVPTPSSHEPMTCPHCRARYRDRSFCTADGRELVRVQELSRFGGDEFTAKFIGVPRTLALSGVMGSLCPTCNILHDLSERFCGRDGTPLMIVN